MVWIKTDNGSYVNLATAIAIQKVHAMPNAAREDRWHVWAAPGKFYWLTMPERDLLVWLDSLERVAEALERLAADDRVLPPGG